MTTAAISQRRTRIAAIFTIVAVFGDIVLRDQFDWHRDFLWKVAFTFDVVVGKFGRFASHGFRKLHTRRGNFSFGDHLYHIIRTIESKNFHLRVLARCHERPVVSHRHGVVAAEDGFDVRMRPCQYGFHHLGSFA